MENCLITKFKGVTSNNELPVYNTLMFKGQLLANATDSDRFFRFYYRDKPYSVKIEVSDGSILTLDVNANATSSFGTIISSDVDRTFIAKITNKYDYTDYADGISYDGFASTSSSSKRIVEITADNLNYSNLTGRIFDGNVANASGISGNIENISNTRLTFLKPSRNCFGKISKMRNLTPLSYGLVMRGVYEMVITTEDIANLQVGRILLSYYTNLKGDVQNLSSNMNITTLILQASNGLYGNVDVLFNTWAQNGKSDVLNFTYGNYEGQRLTGERVLQAPSNTVNTVTFADGSWTGSWES